MRVPEVPNLISFLVSSPLKGTPLVENLHFFENAIFSLIMILSVSFIAILATRRLTEIPGFLQNIVELGVEKLRDFICGILGEKEGLRALPFLGSLFLYILFSNLMGLIPLIKSPTSSYTTTLSLGLLTFFYVQAVGIRRHGIFHYFFHMAGSPGSLAGWLIAPLIVILHLIGELAKPLSLSLRLFGNILGDDILHGAFVGLGVALAVFLELTIPVGIPLQLPFYFLEILTSVIQALVFTLLSTIYILLVLPQKEEF